MKGGIIKKLYLSSYLWKLKKSELLIKIKKLEKEKNIKSKITIKNLKNDMIKFLVENENKKKITFEKKPIIINIPKITKKEKNIRKKILKDIKKTRKKYGSIKRYYYSHIPTLKEYLKVKLYNKKNNKLTKREPMRFIKLNKKIKIYNDIKYKITYLGDKEIKLELFIQDEEYEKIYKIEGDDDISFYKTLYKVKKKLLKVLRKDYAEK